MSGRRFAQVFAIVLCWSAAWAAPFDGRQHDILDLGGRTETVETIVQQEWNGLQTVVSNGTLRVTQRYHTRGGLTEVGPGATLAVGPGARLATGAGDARTRTIRLASGGELRFEQVEWGLDHTRLFVARGASWLADVKRLSLDGAQKDNAWDIAGRAVLVRGIKAEGGAWGHELTVTLRPGGELLLGGPVSTNGAARCRLEVVLEGGRLGLFWDAALAPGLVRVAPGAEVEVLVGQGVDFDPQVIAVPRGAKLKVKRGVRDFKVKLPPRYPVRVRYDRTGRSYWIDADSSRELLAGMGVRYPNPDAESPIRYETVTTQDTLVRRRFPAGKGPWQVEVRLKDRRGGVTRQTLTVARPDKVVGKPAPNETVLVGQCAYGPALELARDVIEQDLCNLYVGWTSVRQTLPETWTNAPDATAWAKTVKDRKMWSMSIYSGDGRELQRKADEAYGGRYLGNNIGEYASFMYQGRKECKIPMAVDLVRARDAFVNRYCGRAAFGWEANFPWMFSTCGAALSCYELQGGIDFICNEQWAIGAQNVAHTSAEARGAARKWGPEYWCAWNAHEWQTTGLPYRTPQKYASCLVGFLQEYVFGTSIIVLESGAQGKQAWKYTADTPDQPPEERGPEGYDGHVARHYREVTKRFYEWVKANPRAKGTPETKIAMALGNLDGYLGENGDFAVWSQHDHADKDAQRWKYGPPEHTQAMLEDIFFPRPKDLVAPFRNRWLAGTPFGQVDVMQVDDESTLADLRRYELLVFGGWNTMTPHVKDVLERYVRGGGTLVMSRPELTTRIDRDFIGYADRDLLPLFGRLPPEGESGAFVETRHGKGRLFLFTARTFPAATDAGRTAYRELVRRLAGEVRQTVALELSETGETDAVCYAVYGRTAYFLNMDTVRARTFGYRCAGRVVRLTLQPCEIRTVEL